MKKKNKILILLCAFGSGSKLLQAHLSQSPNLFTLPAYPILYLPFYFKKWNKGKDLTKEKLLKLIEYQFASIFDTRNISSFNGTSQLGKNKNEYIKISKTKFREYFLKNFINNITLKNTIETIHKAYQYANKNSKKKILYHAHSIKIYKDFLSEEFKNSKSILTIRDPILNFWRSAYADNNIDKLRFDKSDYENLKNYRYLNRIRDIHINFKNLNVNIVQNCKVIKFEDLKTHQYKVLKKICSFFNIKFNFVNMKTPMFGEKLWWGNKIYKGAKENFKFENISKGQRYEQDKFFIHEKVVLKQALLPFLKKCNYIDDRNIISQKFLFWVYIFLPTKYGLKLFISRLHLLNIYMYFNNCLAELSGKKLKNYYFNAMYKHKWSYDIAYLIKYNFFRKKYYYSKNNQIYKFLNFFSKIILYPIFQIELIISYFYRIILIIKIKKTVSNNIKYLKILKIND